MVATGVCSVTGQRARAAQQVERNPPLLQVQVDSVAVVGRLRPRSRAVVQRDHHTKTRAKAKHERLDRHSDETDDVINGVAIISIKGGREPLKQGERGDGISAVSSSTFVMVAKDVVHSPCNTRLKLAGDNFKQALQSDDVIN